MVPGMLFLTSQFGGGPGCALVEIRGPNPVMQAGLALPDLAALPMDSLLPVPKMNLKVFSSNGFPP